jgi:hypothetical protein
MSQPSGIRSVALRSAVGKLVLRKVTSRVGFTVASGSAAARVKLHGTAEPNPFNGLVKMTCGVHATYAVADQRRATESGEWGLQRRKNCIRGGKRNFQDNSNE